MPYHRTQAEALLAGHFYLSQNPLDLAHDLCWSGGGVQQVWGLGIPILKVPFEALALALGRPCFPDALCLGLFIALAAYVALKTWLGRESAQDGAEARAPFTGAGAVALLLLCAPIINALRYRLWIYEEVSAYAYFISISLCCGVVLLARNGRWPVFWLLCALSGFSVLVRPTLAAYGLATALAGAWIMAKKEGCHAVSFPMTAYCKKLLVGMILFGGGLLFLGITNYWRFGNALEFGHRLNIQHGDLLPSVYSTRFGSPFQLTPLTVRARELFGALFEVRFLNDFKWYATGIFGGQAPVFRWREFSFYTFSLPYACLVGLGWATALWTIFRRRSRSAQNKSSSCVWVAEPNVVLAVWSLLASLPLAWFYLNTPVVASRYMLDFAPGFVAAVIALWCWTTSLCARLRVRPGVSATLLVGLLCWQISEIARGARMEGFPMSKTLEEVQAHVGPPAVLPVFPKLYLAGGHSGSLKIPNNGSGWDATNGSLSCCAEFFVDSPQFIELQLVPAPASTLTQPKLEDIRVKIGLESLSPLATVNTNGAWIIRFAGAGHAGYQKGLQTVFIATVPVSQLGQYADVPSSWILQRIQWRE